MSNNIGKEFHSYKRFVSLLYRSSDKQKIANLLGMEFDDFESALLFLQRLVIDYDGHHY